MEWNASGEQGVKGYAIGFLGHDSASALLSPQKLWFMDTVTFSSPPPSRPAPPLNSSSRCPSVASRCGLAERRLAGKQKDLGSICFSSPFSSLQKFWFIWTLFCDFAHTINETLKWLTQLLALMQNHSGGDSVTSRC